MEAEKKINRSRQTAKSQRKKKKKVDSWKETNKQQNKTKALRKGSQLEERLTDKK